MWVKHTGETQNQSSSYLGAQNKVQHWMNLDLIHYFCLLYHNKYLTELLVGLSAFHRSRLSEVVVLIYTVMVIFIHFPHRSH